MANYSILPPTAIIESDDSQSNTMQVLNNDVFTLMIELGPFDVVNSLARTCARLADYTRGHANALADKYAKIIDIPSPDGRMRQTTRDLPNGVRHGVTVFGEIDRAMFGVTYDRGTPLHWTLTSSGGHVFHGHAKSAYVIDHANHAYQKACIVFRMNDDEVRLDTDGKHIVYARCCRAIDFPPLKGFIIDYAMQHNVVKEWVLKIMFDSEVGIWIRTVMHHLGINPSGDTYLPLLDIDDEFADHAIDFFDDDNINYVFALAVTSSIVEPYDASIDEESSD